MVYDTRALEVLARSGLKADEAGERLTAVLIASGLSIDGEVVVEVDVPGPDHSYDPEIFQSYVLPRLNWPEEPA